LRGSINAAKIDIAATPDFHPDVTRLSPRLSRYSFGANSPMIARQSRLWVGAIASISSGNNLLAADQGFVFSTTLGQPTGLGAATTFNIISAYRPSCQFSISIEDSAKKEILGAGPQPSSALQNISVSESC
jgi:hypothetical protein